MSKGLLSTKVDVSKPTDDHWDPIQHFEATGEDLGVPKDYMRRYEAEIARRRKARSDALASQRPS